MNLLHGFRSLFPHFPWFLFLAVLVAADGVMALKMCGSMQWLLFTWPAIQSTCFVFLLRLWWVRPKPMDLITLGNPLARLSPDFAQIAQITANPPKLDQSSQPLLDEFHDWLEGPQVACGATCVVHLSLQLQTGSFFACKRRQEHSNLSQPPTTSASSLSTLRHPNIIKSATGPDPRTHFEEFIVPGSLQSVLMLFGALPERTIRCYLAQTLLALDYLHQLNLVHGDVKGANILVDVNGRVKLIDFGDLDKQSAGTPFWMAPEVLLGAEPTPASDVWSNAAVLIECFTGKPPHADSMINFESLDNFQLIQRLKHSPTPPIPEALSPDAVKFLSDCFLPNAALRPSAAMLHSHVWITTITFAPPLAQLGCNPPVARSGNPTPKASKPNIIQLLAEISEVSAQQTRQRKWNTGSSRSNSESIHTTSSVSTLVVASSTLELALKWLGLCRPTQPIQAYIDFHQGLSPMAVAPPLEHSFVLNS
eukprot:NODE_1386_length_1525_cov_44.293991_g1311_i0.p1 GENE.NODE_1386_length_1525_cov_44.293991_g1311_i0~~NODE_1386_length_1525_cov_44.293991_g1311_i0.p1  ORF type:complete len:479 (-),score=93.21 NODE_1386_length_1525_cov_44.293991_g1311_i0:47-1483(-)